MSNDFKFLKGNIETIILNALYNGDKYGYEITKEIKEKTDNKYEIKQPTLYSYLKRLEEQDLIEPYWGEESHGGRRKYFRLTLHGKETCEQYLSEWNFHRNILDSLISEPNHDDLPEFTPQENLFLGSKKTRKEKNKKTFRDEAENQQLLAELLKISTQQPEDDILDQENIDDIIAEDPIFTENNSALIFDDKISECNYTEITNPEIYTADFQQITDETVDFSEEERITNIIEDQPYDLATDEHFTTDTLSEQQTVIENNFTVSQDDMQNVQPDNNFSHFALTNETEEFVFNNVDTPNFNDNYFNTFEENESEVQYKQILDTLLGDQIINTDEKIAQISPQANKFDNEIGSETLTLSEMADYLSKKGYRIRFYNTTTSHYKAVPLLIKNKINCITAWSTWILFTVLLGISWLICGNSVNILGIGITSLVFLLIPLYFTYLYIIKPNQRIKTSHDPKQALIHKLIFTIAATTALILIDLFILKIEFANPADVMHKFIIPELIILSILFSELFYGQFLKNKTFFN